MCGICGKFIPQAKIAPDSVKTVRGMCQIMRHRGPDDEGIYNGENIIFGVRRLAIIDLEKGHQPITNEDGNIVLVFNGEIYNYRELREHLKKKGHRFSSKGDTEVIVHLFEEEGINFLNKLEGMFAFALYDKKDNTVYVVRDRLGIKPLFYTLIKQQLIFASEIKALLQDKSISREIDINVLYNFLSYNYTVGSDMIISKVKRLPPGCYIKYSDRGYFIKKYWDPYKGGENLGKKASVYMEQFDALLDESVKSHLVSDVPLGILLSGGLDSSAVLSYASRYIGKGIKAFCVSFEDSGYDESVYARRVARQFDAEYNEIRFDQDIVSILKDVVWHSDSLIADASALALFLVSKLAKSKVKVLLSGEGGDEIFFGYDTYIADNLYKYYRHLPAFMKRKIIPSLAGFLPFSVGDGPVGMDYKVKTFIAGALNPAWKAHYWWRQIFSENEKSMLLNDNFFPAAKKEDPASIYRMHFTKNQHVGLLSKASYADTKVWLPDNILALSDAICMANSIEVRVPFLNRKLVEFAFSLPESMKLRFLKGKYILRKAMSKKLPSRLTERKKHGFSVPIKKILRGKLKTYVQDMFSYSNIKKVGFFNPVYMERLIKTHCSREADHSRKIWGLLIFLIWHSVFIKNEN